MEQIELKKGFYIIDCETKLIKGGNVSTEYKLLQFDSLIEASNYEKDYCQNNYHKFYVGGKE